MKTLQSWRNVIAPRAEVMQGRFDNLAADLMQASQGQGGEEYSNPVEFFSRTYMTDGIRGLMMEALKRVTGQYGAPVIQVKTAFGGGKTHSMLALYHLMHGGFNARSVPVVRGMMDDLGLSALPRVNVAVISGTFEGVSEPREVADIPVNTLWGNIAAQLGGYEYVKAADRDRKAPGNFALLKMFDACGPCLVLIDELTAYGRKLYGTDKSSAGTFSNFQNFVQELTEAAKYSKNSLLVAAMPESKTENGDENGIRVFEILDNLFKRVESVWKPVEPREGFEVVKLRLFQECSDDRAREETAEAFYRMYEHYKDDFPAEAHTTDYKERLISCYPIHPEIFDRLYGDWSTLQGFQRTRGVLSFIAAIVHDLWESGDTSPLIMPGSVNVANKDIHAKVTGSLPGGSVWNAILDNEIDGKESVPCLLDERDRFREYSAASRVARTILLGSAPSARGQAVRGVEKSRILLGTVRPDENISVYIEALGELRGALSYLYANDAANRFWYDTVPTLRKKAAELKAQQRDSDVEGEIHRRLVSLKGSAMVSHMWPNSEGNDVPDKQDVRLVILAPNDGEAEALKILLSRKFMNMLLFVKTDRMKLDDLREAVRVYLAWKYIARESRTLNLTEQQVDECRKTIDKTSTEIDRLAREAWSVVLVPECLDGRDVNNITFKTVTAKSAGSITENVLSSLSGDELSRKTDPDALNADIARYIWKNSDDIEIKRLWELLCTYCYLPRIAGFSVLESAIIGSIDRKYFALAHGKNGGKYEGLTLNAPYSVEMTDYIVKRDIAEKLITPEPPEPPTVGTTTTQIQDILPIDDTPKPKAIHNFSMSAQLLEDPTPAKYFMKLYNDIIAVLQHDVSGATFDITLEVNMHATGTVSDDTRKVVTDNCNIRKVTDYSFD